MSVIRVETELPFEKLLQAVEQLSVPDLEALTTQVLNIQAQRKAPCLSADESELLLKINQGISPDMQTRFDRLVAKRQAETLTPEEHRELLALTRQIEAMDAERMACLADLSRIRGMSLENLMNELGIEPPAYA
jgi:hypothetical protein